jgi:hypothetical protein
VRYDWRMKPFFDLSSANKNWIIGPVDNQVYMRPADD